jgi:CubicO group peptidase (beta-lactamase class C family)
MKKALLILLVVLLACRTEDSPAPKIEMYFPPNSSATWETVTPASLGWNEAAIPDLKAFLATSNSRSLIVLKDGKIAIEEYLGTHFTGGAFAVTSNWYWASAGKTLTSALVGIAASQNKINLDAKTSDYLGVGWTSLTAAQENKITVRNQITMTTGLDDGATDPDCTDKPCLVYKADPGSRWAYHNAPYTLLDGVIASGTGQSLTNFFNTEIGSKIGMNGTYVKSGYNNVFYSTPRSMARFGLLLLNNGAWNGASIVPDKFVEMMRTTSQPINKSYGYLTWLNGKDSYMIPRSQIVFPGALSPNAPADLYAAMGKNGQLINVVPSQNIVVIRVGDAPDNSLVPFKLQDDLWIKLNAVITK